MVSKYQYKLIHFMQVVAFFQILFAHFAASSSIKLSVSHQTFKEDPSHPTTHHQIFSVFRHPEADTKPMNETCLELTGLYVGPNGRTWWADIGRLGGGFVLLWTWISMKIYIFLQIVFP